MRRRGTTSERLYLRGRVFWCWGYDAHGTQWRETTRQTDRKAALEVAREIERKRAVRPHRAADETTLEAALGLVIANDRRLGNSPKTIKFHTDKGRHLIRLLGARCRIATISKAVANNYTDKRLEEGAARHTIQKEIRVLIQAMHQAREAGAYSGTPADIKPDVFRKRSRYYKPRTRWLSTAEQIRALVAHTSEGLQVRVDRRLHVIAYLHTGVRKNELFQIRPEHVNLRERIVWIDGTKTDRAPRNVHLSDTAVAVFKAKLASAKPGQPLFEHWASSGRDLRGAFRRAKAAAAKRAGVEPAKLADWPSTISFNDLRRTFCSLMATRGVPMQHCAALLGHASLDMVMEVYGRLAPSSLQEAVAKLPAIPMPRAVQVRVITKGRKTAPGAQVAGGRRAKKA